MAQDDLIHFYGVVKNEDNVALYGATVMLFACLPEGVEEPLANTFTDENGQYFLTTRRLTNSAEVQGFRVRACFEGTIPEELALPVEQFESVEQVGESEQPYEEAVQGIEPEYIEIEYCEEQEQEQEQQQEEAAWTPQIFDQISTPGFYNPLNNISADSVAYVRDGQIWIKVFGRV